MEALFLALTSLVNAAVIAVIARRLLGAPVGWPRSILLALLVNAGAAPPLLQWASRSLGLATQVPVRGVEAAQLVLVTSLVVAWLIVAEVVAGGGQWSARHPPAPAEPLPSRPRRHRWGADGHH